MNFQENSTNYKQIQKINMTNNIKIEIYDHDKCMIKFNKNENDHPGNQNNNYDYINEKYFKNSNFKTSGSLIFSKSISNCNVSPQSMRNSKTSLFYNKLNNLDLQNIQNCKNSNLYKSKRSFDFNRLNHSLTSELKANSKLSETIINVKNSDFLYALSDDTFDLSNDLSYTMHKNLKLHKNSRLCEKETKLSKRYSSNTLTYLKNKIIINQFIDSTNFSNEQLIRDEIKRTKNFSDRIFCFSDKNSIPKKNQINRVVNFNNSNNSIIKISTNKLNEEINKKILNRKRNNYSEISNLSEFNSSENFYDNSMITNSLSISKSTINKKKNSSSFIFIDQIPNSENKSQFSNKTILYSPSTICNYYLHSNEVTPSLANSVKRIKKDINIDNIAKRNLTKEITDCIESNNSSECKNDSRYKGLNLKNNSEVKYEYNQIIINPNNFLLDKNFEKNDNCNKHFNLMNNNILIKDYEAQENLEKVNQTEGYEDKINLNSITVLQELNNFNNDTNSLNFSLSKNSNSISLKSNNNKFDNKITEDNNFNNNFNIINLINGLNTTKKTPIRTIKYNKDQFKSAEKNSMVSSNKKDSNSKLSSNNENFNINYEIFKNELNACENIEKIKNNEFKDNNFTLNTINNNLLSLSKMQSNIKIDDFANSTNSRLSPTKELNNIFQRIDIKDNQLINNIDDEKIMNYNDNTKTIENLIFENDSYKERNESNNILNLNYKHKFNQELENCEIIKNNIKTYSGSVRDNKKIDFKDKNVNEENIDMKKCSYERGKINIKLNFETSNDFKMEEIFNTKHNTCKNKGKYYNFNQNKTIKNAKLSKSNEKKSILIKEKNSKEENNQYAKRTKDLLNNCDKIKIIETSINIDSSIKDICNKSEINKDDLSFIINKQNSKNWNFTNQIIYQNHIDLDNSRNKNIIKDLDQEQELGKQITTNKLLDSCSDKKNPKHIFLFQNEIENLNSLISDEITINNSNSINICNDSLINNNRTNNPEKMNTSKKKENSYNSLNKYITRDNYNDEDLKSQVQFSEEYINQIESIHHNSRLENENFLKNNYIQKENKEGESKNCNQDNNVDVSKLDKKVNNLYLSISELQFENSHNIESLQNLLDKKNGNLNEIESDKLVSNCFLKDESPIIDKHYESNNILNSIYLSKSIIDKNTISNCDAINNSIQTLNKHNFTVSNFEKNQGNIVYTKDESNEDYEEKYKIMSNIKKKSNFFIGSPSANCFNKNQKNLYRKFSLASNNPKSNERLFTYEKMRHDTNNNSNGSKSITHKINNTSFYTYLQNLNDSINKRIIYKRSKSSNEIDNVMNNLGSIGIKIQKEDNLISEINPILQQHKNILGIYSNDDSEIHKLKKNNSLTNKDVLEEILDNLIRKSINSINLSENFFSEVKYSNKSNKENDKFSNGYKLDDYYINKNNKNSAISTKDTKSNFNDKDNYYKDSNKENLNNLLDIKKIDQLDEDTLNKKINSINILDKIYVQENANLLNSKTYSYTDYRYNHIKDLHIKTDKTSKDRKYKNDISDFITDVNKNECNLDDIDQEEIKNNFYVILKENKKLRDKNFKEKKIQKNLNLLELYNRNQLDKNKKVKENSNYKTKKITFDFLFSNLKDTIKDNEKDIFNKLKNRSRSCTNIEELLLSNSKIIKDSNLIEVNNNHRTNVDYDTIIERNKKDSNEDNSNKKKFLPSNSKSKTIEILYECEQVNNPLKTDTNQQLELIREYVINNKSSPRKINTSQTENREKINNYSNKTDFLKICRNNSTSKFQSINDLKKEELIFKNKFFKNFNSDFSSISKKKKVLNTSSRDKNINKINNTLKRTIRNRKKKINNKFLFDSFLRNIKDKSIISSLNKLDFSTLYNQYQTLPFSSFILIENNEINKVKTNSKIRDKKSKNLFDSKILTNATIEKIRTSKHTLKSKENLSFKDASPIIKQKNNEVKTPTLKKFTNTFLFDNLPIRTDQNSNKPNISFDDMLSLNQINNSTMKIKKEDINNDEIPTLVPQTINFKENQDNLCKTLINNGSILNKPINIAKDPNKNFKPKYPNTDKNNFNYKNLKVNTIKFEDSFYKIEDNKIKIDNFNNYQIRKTNFFENEKNQFKNKNLKNDEIELIDNEILFLNTFDSLATDELMININSEKLNNQNKSNQKEILNYQSGNDDFILKKDRLENELKLKKNIKIGNLNFKNHLVEPKNTNFRFADIIKLQVLNGDNDHIFDDSNC